MDIDMLSYCISDIYKEYKNKAIEDDLKQTINRDIEVITRFQANTKTYISMLANKINRMSKDLNKSFEQVANILLKNHIIRIIDYDKVLRYYQQFIYKHNDYMSF